MMHLAPHIAKLLEKHDCVIIPSFGGIISNYKGATIHPTRHLFSPPSRQLLFNKNLVSNDGLLANKLSEDLGLSYAQAVQLISDEVNALVSMLNNGQRIYWPGVGGFFLDVEKNIQFTQDSLQNYLSDSFGMPELEVPAVIREYSPQRASAFQMRPAVHSNDSLKRTTRKRVLLAVLALPLAAGLALLPFSDSRFQVAHLAKIGSSMDNDSKSLYAPSIARFNASPLQMIDLPSGSLGMPASIGNLPQPGAHAVSQNSLPVENNIRDKAKEVLISEGYNFQVIAGSFSSKSNANALVKKLRKNNFDAEIIGRAPNGYYRVSAGKVVDRQEADSLSEKLTLEGIQSWPMEI